MELYRLRFNTAGKSAEDIEKDYNFNPPSREICGEIAKAYSNLDDLIVLGNAWESNPDVYSIYDWDDSADDKLKEFIYLQEQDSFFGSYVNERKRFDQDWENGEYEPGRPICFNKSDFEVIERIKM